MKKHTGWLLAGLMAGMVIFAGSAVSAEEVLEEQVLWEAEGVALTATGITEDEFYKYLQIHAENSSEQDVTLAADRIRVNGMGVLGNYYCDLPAGTASDEGLYVEKELLDLVGIDTVASMEVDFYMYDPVTYDTIFQSDEITLTTEGNEGYQQDFDESGDVVYDANGIKIFFKGRIDADWEYPVLAFFAENHSGREIILETEEVKINGAESDAWIFDVIPDGKASLSQAFVWETLPVVENIEMNFTITDSEIYEEIDTVVYQNADPALLAPEAADDETDDGDNFFMQAQNHYEEENENQEQAALFDQTLAEQVIFDEDGVTITVKDIWMKAEYGRLNLHAENKLDYPVQASLQDFFINNGSIDTGIVMEIAPGAECEESVVIPLSYLRQWGFDRVASIDFNMSVYAGGDSSNAGDTIDAFKQVHLTTEGNEDYEQVFDVQGEVLYDSNGIRILAFGVAQNGFEKRILVCVENQTDLLIHVGGENIIVDGETGDGSSTYQLGCDVPSGKYGMGVIYGDLGMDKDITVDSVEMTLEISNNVNSELRNYATYET
ncbi:MAG: hypothetical protein KBT01_01960, partial [Clostridiales bacterium]|nr:hypothetical protein [Candidatus Blautia equi]